MKTKYWMLFVAILMASLSCKGQTDEQKEMIREMEKKAARAQQMSDSIMNTPEMKKLLKQQKELQDKYEREKQATKEPKKEKPIKEVSANSHLERFKISKSTAKKIENWTLGAADIVMLEPNFRGQPKQIKIGNISADGSFNLSLPDKLTCEKKVADFFKCDVIASSDETSYSNPNAAISYVQGIMIMRGEENLGMLSVASSKQQMYNHSPYGQYRGEKGFRIEWWFAEDETLVKARCTGSIDNYGDKVASSIRYELLLKQGWNMVKVEVLEAHSPEFYKTKGYSVVPEMPTDARWVFYSRK